MSHWHLRLSISLCLVTVVAFVGETFGQQLQQLRSEVRVTDPAPPSRSTNHDDNNDDNHRYDDGSCDLDDDGLSGDELLGLGYLSGFVLASPFWIPISAAGDNWGRMGYFPAFPYQYDLGYMIVHPDEYSGVRGPLLKFPWAVRARSDAGTNFAGLNWVGGNVLVESTMRLGIESDFRFYQEDLLPGNAPAQADTAWLGDANVFIRFAQSEKMQMRSGFGINWLSDRQHTDVGFNFTYAGDYYPIKPWVISSEFDWGLLGDETLLHARITTGLQYKGLEAYVGYDFVDIGKFQQNSMILGVRLWF